MGVGVGLGSGWVGTGVQVGNSGGFVQALLDIFEPIWVDIELADSPWDLKVAEPLLNEV